MLTLRVAVNINWIKTHLEKYQVHDKYVDLLWLQVPSRLSLTSQLHGEVGGMIKGPLKGVICPNNLQE